MNFSQVFICRCVPDAAVKGSMHITLTHSHTFSLSHTRTYAHPVSHTHTLASPLSVSHVNTHTHMHTHRWGSIHAGLIKLLALARLQSLLIIQKVSQMSTLPYNG